MCEFENREELRDVAQVKKNAVYFVTALANGRVEVDQPCLIVFDSCFVGT